MSGSSHAAQPLHAPLVAVLPPLARELLEERLPDLGVAVLKVDTEPGRQRRPGYVPSGA
jgi:hypothetical protein